MSLAKSVLVPDSLEEIFPGLFCERYGNNQIIAFRVLAVSAPLLEAWADYVVATLETWPVDCPYLALHSLAKSGISLQFATLVNFDLANMAITPSGQARAVQVITTRNLCARIALSFNISVSGHVNKVLTENQTRRCRQDIHPAITYKTFYSEDTALAWLTSVSTPIDVSTPIELRMDQEF